jgi:hypothetical protein
MNIAQEHSLTELFEETTLACKGEVDIRSLLPLISATGLPASILRVVLREYIEWQFRLWDCRTPEERLAFRMELKATQRSMH